MFFVFRLYILQKKWIGDGVGVVIRSFTQFATRRSALNQLLLHTMRTGSEWYANHLYVVDDRDSKINASIILTALNYFCINHGDQFEMIINRRLGAKGSYLTLVRVADRIL